MNLQIYLFYFNFILVFLMTSTNDTVVFKWLWYTSKLLWWALYFIITSSNFLSISVSISCVMKNFLYWCCVFCRLLLMQNVFSVDTCSWEQINHGFEDGLLFILILYYIPSGHTRISVLSLPHPYLVTPLLR